MRTATTKSSCKNLRVTVKALAPLLYSTKSVFTTEKGCFDKYFYSIHCIRSDGLVHETKQGKTKHLNG